MSGDALDDPLTADVGRKTLVVAGDVGLRRGAGASAVVEQGRLRGSLSAKLSIVYIEQGSSYSVASVVAVLVADLAAGVLLGAAPCLPGDQVDSGGVNGNCATGGVVGRGSPWALSRDEASHGRCGEKDGGVEHVCDGDLRTRICQWRSSIQCQRRALTALQSIKQVGLVSGDVWKINSTYAV